MHRGMDRFYRLVLIMTPDVGRGKAGAGPGSVPSVTALQWVALVLAVASTLVGAGSFLRGAGAIVRVVRRGAPAPERRAQPWRRTVTAVRQILAHRRFRSRPGVAVAHWAVMVSFPVLFVTLLSSYWQIADPGSVLPVVGGWRWLGWLTEIVAWAALVGIGWLAAVRQREHPRRGRRAAGGPSAAAGGPAAVEGTGSRASRFFGSNAGQAYFVEAVIGVVVACVLALRGLEVALALRAQGITDLAGGVPPWTGPTAFAMTSAEPVSSVDIGYLWDFPFTAWFGASWVGVETATLEAAVVALALVKILVSSTWLAVVGLRPAMGVAWHRFTAIVNVWARRELDGRPALRAVPPVRASGEPVDFDHLEDLADDARLGVGRVEDLSWKGLLDLATCTECGRCQEQCPAWASGKVLSPKLMVLALRDHAFATTPGLRVGANASTSPAGRTASTGVLGLSAGDGHAGVDALSLVGDVVDPQALWDCTTCGACVQACPVDIEHVDLFVDLRRHQVLMESAFPAELGKAFAGIERRGNPWGAAPRDRLAWTKGLDFTVPVIGRDVTDASELDYLFWVGCAGAYDERGRRTSRAVAELLHMAGVRFAVLGDAEGCSGDPARRAGNELLFQQQARATIGTLGEARAARIVVTCPHCLNALGNEYPQLGGTFEVVHHTELLDRLVREGRLVPQLRDGAGGGAASGGTASGGGPASGGTVTWHDPCYLGRHNGVYTPPRELLAATGMTLTEMPRSGERSFCCGGGGARAFMEEAPGTRMSTNRGAEAVATGAERVATGCPFCVTMLTQGVEATATSAPAPEVVDVAVLLLESARAR